MATKRLALKKEDFSTSFANVADEVDLDGEFGVTFAPNAPISSLYELTKPASTESGAAGFLEFRNEQSEGFLEPTKFENGRYHFSFRLIKDSRTVELCQVFFERALNDPHIESLSYWLNEGGVPEFFHREDAPYPTGAERFCS